MFLEEEKIENKASEFYHKISLLESGAVKRTAFVLILGNMAIMAGIIIAIKTGQANADKLSILYRLIPIGCELVCIVLERNDERKFNKMVRSGIVLKTTIDHKQSRAAISGFYDALLIYSYYICEDGTRLGFAQMKHHYANMTVNKIFLFILLMEYIVWVGWF
ncbi:MAG: hypothetical protein HDR22_10495 [Lachnospiraceae bacterium]|nr:hypothetical protein [Lachnospiraceae bacterium]